MRFKSDCTFFFHHGQQFADHQDQVQIILLFPFGATDTFAHAGHRAFKNQRAIADQCSTNRRTDNDETFVRCGVNNRGEVTAGQNKAAKNGAKHHG